MSRRRDNRRKNLRKINKARLIQSNEAIGNAVQQTRESSLEHIFEVYGVQNSSDLTKRLNYEMTNLLDFIVSLQKKNDKSPPRAHHVNPVFALSNFSEGSRRENFRLVQHIDGKSSKRKAAKVALIENFNTAKSILIDDPYVIERYYSRIEDKVAPRIKKFYPSELEFASQIESLTTFLALQNTRSVRQRDLVNQLGETEFKRILDDFEKTNKIPLEVINHAKTLTEDISLLMTLRHIGLHAIDLRNRSIVFVYPDKSKLITAPDPAVFLDDNFTVLSNAIINTMLLYPISRDVLVMFPKRKASEPIIYSTVTSDAMIDHYNLLVFSQSPENEVFMHPDDEDYFIDLVRSCGVEYDPIRL